MLSPSALSLLLSDLEPGEVYRRCLSLGEPLDYAATEQLVYGVEVRYAIQVLQGETPRLYNFGDLDGAGDAALFRALDASGARSVAFVGAGPYPVTALILRERSPELQITCFENNLVGFLLGQAVLRRLAPDIPVVFGDAHEVELRNFDLIVLAAMVEGRAELARRILEGSSAHVLVRASLDWEHPRLHSVAARFKADGSLA